MFIPPSSTLKTPTYSWSKYEETNHDLPRLWQWLATIGKLERGYHMLIAYTILLLALIIGGGRFASQHEKTTPLNRALRRSLGYVNFIKATAIKSNGRNRHLIFATISNGHKTRVFMDPGADICLITPTEAKRLGARLIDHRTTFKGVGGQETTSEQKAIVPIELTGYTTYVHAIVTEHTPVTDFLIGLDWMRKNKAVLDCGKSQIWFRASRKTVYALTEIPELKSTTTGQVPPKILIKYRKLFSEPTGLPPKRPCDLNIRFKRDANGNPLLPGISEEIIERRPDRVEFMKKEIQSLLAKGFIELDPAPVVNPCCAFVVEDKGSESRGEAKMRIVYDFRRLNDVIDIDHPLLPRILDMVRKVSKGKYFTKLDLRAGFHNLRMTEEASQYLSVSYPGFGTYRWKVLPFGLASGPGAMERLMRITLNELLLEGVEVYLDDILIYAHTKEEHDRLLHLTLTRLEENGFHLKESKCAVGVDNVDFLGYRIKDGRYRAIESHTQGITDFSLPTTVKAWQRFHGMVNYYRLHVPVISTLAKPITAVFGKRGKIEPTPELVKAFNDIKEEIAKKLELESLEPGKPVHLVTDASPVGWGAYVTQDPTFKSPGIAWLAGTFTPAEQAWHQNEKELFAVVQAFRRYPEFFAGQRVIVRADNEVITGWRDLNTKSDKIKRWYETIIEFHPSWIWIPAEENVVTDALSRHLLETGKATIDEHSVLKGMDVVTINWIQSRSSRAKTVSFSESAIEIPDEPAPFPHKEIDSTSEKALLRPNHLGKSESTSSSVTILKLSDPLPDDVASEITVSPSKEEKPAEFLSPEPYLLGKDGVPIVFYDQYDDEFYACRHKGCYSAAELDGKCLKHHTTKDRDKKIKFRQAQSAKLRHESQKLLDEAVQLGQEAQKIVRLSDHIVPGTCWRDCRTHKGDNAGWLCWQCQQALGIETYQGPYLYSPDGYGENY